MRFYNQGSFDQRLTVIIEAMTKSRWREIVLFLSVVALGGCGGSEVTTGQLPPSRQVVQPPAKKPEFEIRTDTIAAVRKEPRKQIRTPRHDLQIRFMVQIGAYKDPGKASDVQITARHRYHLPVLNDYHTKLGLYQIRIGFFETRGAAQAFKKKMQLDYPADYNDCWVVQLKR